MSQMTDVIEMAESVIAEQQIEIARLNAQIEMMKSLPQQPLFIKEYDFDGAEFQCRSTEVKPESNAESEEKIAEQSRQIQNLQNEISKLNIQLTDKKTELESCAKREREFQSRVDDLEDKLLNYGKSDQILNSNAYKELQSNYESEKEQVRLLEAKSKKAEADYKSLDLEKTKLERRCEDLTQKLTKAQEKVEQRSAKAAQENLKKKEAEYKKLKKEYDKLQTSFNTQQKKLEELQAKYDILLQNGNLTESADTEENLPAKESEASPDVIITKEHLSRLINALQDEQEETAKRLKKLDADMNAEKSNPSNYNGFSRKKPVMTKRAKRRVTTIQAQLNSTQEYGNTVAKALEALTSADVSMTDFAKKVYDSLLCGGDLNQEPVVSSDTEVTVETENMESDIQTEEQSEEKISNSKIEDLKVNPKSVSVSKDSVSKDPESLGYTEKSAPYSDAVNLGTLFDKNGLNVVDESFCVFGSMPDEVLRAKFGINGPEMRLTEYGVKVMKSVIKYLSAEVNSCSELTDGGEKIMAPLSDDLDAAYKHIRTDSDLCGFDRLYYLGCKLEDEGIAAEAIFTAERTLPKPDRALSDALKKEVTGAVLFANPVEHSLSFYHTKSERLGEEARRMIEAGIFRAKE